MIFLIENSCLNCLKVDRIQDYESKKNDFFFDRKIHKQVGKLRRRLSETQFTGLWREWPPLEIAARWRCVPLIKNMTAHYDSQFCVSFCYCFHCEAYPKDP